MTFCISQALPQTHQASQGHQRIHSCFLLGPAHHLVDPLHTLVCPDQLAPIKGRRRYKGLRPCAAPPGCYQESQRMNKTTAKPLSVAFTQWFVLSPSASARICPSSESKRTLDCVPPLREHKSQKNLKAQLSLCSPCHRARVTETDSVNPVTIPTPTSVVWWLFVLLDYKGVLLSFPWGQLTHPARPSLYLSQSLKPLVCGPLTQLQYNF